VLGVMLSVPAGTLPAEDILPGDRVPMGRLSLRPGPGRDWAHRPAARPVCLVLGSQSDAPDPPLPRRFARGEITVAAASLSFRVASPRAYHLLPLLEVTLNVFSHSRP